MPFTVILGTYNEENRIREALEPFRDRVPIVVVDDFSTDATASIAREYTSDVIQRKNPPYLTPNCYRFRFDLAKTEYILILFAGQIHTKALVELYAEVARKRRYKAVATYNIVYSYGRPVNAYGRPFANKVGSFKFFRKDAVDLSRSVIHNELPFVGSVDDVYFPPRSRKYCIFSFRDDNAEMTETKHTRYANADAAMRFLKGERSDLFKFVWVFLRHLLGCLLWRGAILDGTAGIVNAIWRATYFLNIEIRLWELQENFTKEVISRKHRDLKQGIVNS